MAKLLLWTGDETETAGAFAPALKPQTSDIGVRDEIDETPSFGETTAAAFNRENLTLAAIGRLDSDAHGLSDLSTYGEADIPVEYLEQTQGLDPNFKPLHWMQDNLTPEQFGDLVLPVRTGYFDEARNEHDLQARIDRWVTEEQLTRTMEQGPFIGAFIGSIGAAVTDVASLSAAGAAMRLRTVANLFRNRRVLGTAAEGVVQAAVPEVGLQALQDLRTAQESFLNIGTSGLLGGGIGYYARFVDKRHPMHPDNPVHPLNERNLDQEPVRVRDADGEFEEIVPESVGAAARPAETFEAATRLTDKLPGPLKRVLRPATDLITGATPAGRALRYRSQAARESLLRMMDIGGQLTRTARFGKAVAYSAEDYKRDFTQASEVLFNYGSELHQKANQALGATAFRTKLNADEFNDVARKMLTNIFQESDRQSLIMKFGEDGAETVLSHAERYANKINETNRFYEENLINEGLLRNEAEVTRLEGEVTAAKDKLEAVKRQSAGDRAQGAQAPEGRKETVAELRAAVATAQAGLNKELEKASAMGDEYGHAQLYDAAVVLRDKEAFETWLLDVLVDHPDEQWLFDTYGLSQTQFDQMGDTALPSGVTREEILRDWMVDEHLFQVHRAEMAEQAAVQNVKKSEQDLTDTAIALGLARPREAQLKVSQVRKFRDSVAAGIASREAARDAATAEARAARDDLALLRAAGPTVRGDRLRGEQTARAFGRAERTAQAETRANKRLEQAVQKQRVIDEKLRQVEEAATQAKLAKAGIQDAVDDAFRAKKIADKSLRKALAKINKDAPLYKVVEDIRNNIATTGKVPHGVIDRIAVEPGRVKARRLNLTPEQRQAGQSAGFLRSDLGNILRIQYDQLAGYLGLQRSFRDFEGTSVSSWADVERYIEQSYEDLAEASSDPKARSKLNDEREKALTDARGLKDRLLGTTQVGVDRDSWAYWLSGKARQFNFIRFGAGFGLTSMTDVATVALTNGKLAGLVREHGAEAVRLMREMQSENPSDFRAMLGAIESSMSGMRIAQLNDADDAIQMFGIGAHGSRKQRITGGIDYVGRELSEKTNLISGMAFWNKSWKIMTGLYNAHRIQKLTRSYDTLDEKDVAALASLGIGRAEAKQMSGFLEKYGEEVRGVFDPRLELWTGEAGLDAARNFRMSVQRAIDRAVITPGIGDTPLVMDHWAAKLLLQFQTFAFTFMNRYMLPVSQKLADQSDWKQLITFGHLAWAGLAVVLGKDLIRGEDPTERLAPEQWGQTAFDVVDRSGLMGYLSPYVDATLKAPLGDESVGSTIGIGQSSRFARNNWWQSMLGVSFGMVRDLGEAVGAVGSGDWERIRKKGMGLLPWNSHLRLMANTHAAFVED